MRLKALSLALLLLVTTNGARPARALGILEVTSDYVVAEIVIHAILTMFGPTIGNVFDSALVDMSESSGNFNLALNDGNFFGETIGFSANGGNFASTLISFSGSGNLGSDPILIQGSILRPSLGQHVLALRSQVGSGTTVVSIMDQTINVGVGLPNQFPAELNVDGTKSTIQFAIDFLNVESGSFHAIATAQVNPTIRVDVNQLNATKLRVTAQTVPEPESALRLGCVLLSLLIAARCAAARVPPASGADSLQTVAVPEPGGRLLVAAALCVLVALRAVRHASVFGEPRGGSE